MNLNLRPMINLGIRVKDYELVIASEEKKMAYLPFE